MKIIKNFKRNQKTMKNIVNRFIAILLIVSGSITFGNSQCAGITLTCNTALQISLNPDCMFTVTPSVMLQTQDFPDNDYTIVILDQDGNSLPSATVGSDQIGLTLDVIVSLTACNLSCWGTITVEDKFAPVLDCGIAINLDCLDDIEPFNAITNTDGVALPGITECSNYFLEHEDVTSIMSCTGANPGYTIERYWFATDEHGNKSSCIQTINVGLGDIDDVVIPANIYLTCDDAGWDNDNFPNPDYLESIGLDGYPSFTGCPNILFSSSDAEFDLCGVGYKWVRTWLVIDWCTGEEKNGVQIIKLEDLRAPIVTCPVDAEDPGNAGLNAANIPAGPDCKGDWNVIAPIVINDCSSYTWIVEHKFGDGVSDVPPPGEIFVSTNVSGSYPNFTISDLPIGRSWIRYTVTDACGFQTQCFTEVFVYDNTQPTAICEGGTVVSVAPNDCKTIMAESIDDGSWDACGDDLTYMVSWTDSNYGPSVEVCCSSVGTRTIYLKVTDGNGNTSICTGSVHVTDHSAPTIHCPIDVTIGCDESTAPSNTGNASGTGSCANPSISYDDANMQNTHCNTGFFIRTWIATAANGQVVTCPQKITIISDDPLSESDISWPTSMVNLSGCSGTQDIDPVIIGHTPTINNNSACIDAATTYSDEVVANPQNTNACYQVKRTWKVTDWCLYEPSLPVYFYEFEQYINISGGSAPQFPACEDQIVSDGVDDCQGIIDLTKVATDDCTTILKYNWTLDLYSDGSNNHSGNGNHIYGTYPSGTHEVTVYAEDDCGNIGSCTCTVVIDDEKAPTPICFAEITLVLDSDGNAEIWAEEFDIKSEDTCDPSEMLTFSFTADGNTPALTFTCDDLPNGIGAEIQLEMHVIDTDGNSEFCLVTLILQDSGDHCTDSSGARATVAGEVRSEVGQEVEDVEVALVNVTDNAMLMEMTDQDGDYVFTTVDYYDGYSIDPNKNTDHLNGVSTLDLVLIQKHILNLDTLDSPFKLIAADINASSNISATDLIELRKLILGIYVELPNNDPYVFVPESYEFFDQSIPWGYDNTIDINALYNDEMDANFIAVKVGDVNGSADYSNATSGTVSNRSSHDLKLTSVDQEFSKGELVEVNLELSEAIDLVGFQFSLITNDYLTLTAVKSQNVELTNQNYSQSIKGMYNFSWNDINANSFENTLITLSFIADKDGQLSDALELANDLIHAEAYNDELTTFDIELDVNNIDHIANDIVLYQNTPNPFSNSTSVRFNSKIESAYTLEVIDINGRVVSSVNNTATKGINEITFFRDQFNSNGLYYYQLTIGELVETKKMILMK